MGTIRRDESFLQVPYLCVRPQLSSDDADELEETDDDLFLFPAKEFSVSDSLEQSLNGFLRILLKRKEKLWQQASLVWWTWNYRYYF